jgi:hypothetical protein
MLQFNHLAFDISPPVLIEGGYYCKAVNVGAILGIRGMDREKMRQAANGDLDCELQATNPKMVKQVVVTTRRALEKIERPNGQVMVFASSRKHARRLVQMYRAAKYTVDHIFADGADRDAAPRAELIEAYRSRAIQILVVVGCLTRGFSHDPVELIVIAFATKSRARWMQACGRGSRPWSDGGKAANYLLDFGGNFEEFGSPDMSVAEAIAFDMKPPPTRDGEGGGGAPGPRNPMLSIEPSQLPIGVDEYSGQLVKCSPVIRKGCSEYAHPKLLAEVSFHIEGLNVHIEKFHIEYYEWPEAQLRCADLLAAFYHGIDEVSSLNKLSVHAWARLIEEASVKGGPRSVELRRFPNYLGKPAWQVVSIGGIIIHNTSPISETNHWRARNDPWVRIRPLEELICHAS